jgi:hypothetical protein
VSAMVGGGVTHSLVCSREGTTELGEMQMASLDTRDVEKGGRDRDETTRPGQRDRDRETTG